MKSYNGQESYIFFSYCHADKDEVLAIADKLFNMNFRIWYDKYLSIGEPFDDDIAEHIKNCEVFIIFLSENYMKSEYCDMELKYAQSKGRKCFAVYLNEVDMEKYAGMEMCLRTSNNINGYLYDTQKCAEMIADSTLVVNCKREDNELYEPIVLKDKLRKPKNTYMIPILSFFTVLVFLIQTHDFDSTFLIVFQVSIFIISCMLFSKQEAKYKYQTEKTSKYSIYLLTTAFFNLDILSAHLCVAREEYKQIIIMLAVSVFHYFSCMIFTVNRKTLPSWGLSLLTIYIVRFAVLLLSLIMYSTFPEHIRWAAVVDCIYIAFGFLMSAGTVDTKNKTIDAINWVLIVVCLLFTAALIYKKSFDYMISIAGYIDYNIFLPLYYYIEHKASYLYYIIFVE